MFKLPNNNRLDEIADMIPEWISVMSNEKSGYSARISKIGEMMRIVDIAHELGISVEHPKSVDYDFLMKIVKDNDIPNFAVVISKNERYRVAFSNYPSISLIREYGDFCIGGRIIIVSDSKVTRREKKAMMASGAESYFHVNYKEACAF